MTKENKRHFLLSWPVRIAGILAIAISVFADTLIHKYVQFAIDTLAGSPPSMFGQASNQEIFLSLSGLLLLSLAVFAFFQWVSRRLFGLSTFSAMADKKRTLWKGLLEVGRLPGSRREFLSLYANDTRVAAQAEGQLLQQSATSAAIVIFGFGFLFSLDPILTVVFAALSPILPLSVRWVSRKHGGLHESAQKSLAKLTRAFHQSLETVRLQRIRSSSTLWMSRVETLLGQYQESRLGVLRNGISAELFSFLFTWVSFTVLLVLVCRRVAQGALSAGEAVAFLGYLGMVNGGLSRLGPMLNGFQRARSSERRLETSLTLKTTRPKESAPIAPVAGAPVYQLKDLRFPFGEKSRFRPAIDLRIEEGEKIAVTGGVGAGKSTLLQVLSGIQSPVSGRIELFGNDMEFLTRSELSAAIAYLGSQPFLFADTVMRNVSVDGSLSKDSVWEALDQVGLFSEIKAFPAGLQTHLGERGVQLSGGQRQRLALARALVRRTPVLILDDALSALDRDNEEMIWNELFGSGQTLVWAGQSPVARNFFERKFRMERTPQKVSDQRWEVVQ